MGPPDVNRGEAEKGRGAGGQETASIAERAREITFIRSANSVIPC